MIISLTMLTPTTIADEENTVEVTITGISKTKGDIRISIYSAENEFPSESDIMDFFIIPVKDATASCTFKVSKKGKYAVALMHDMNKSGKMEYNLVGVPKEPYGFSKNPTVIFKAPTFEECAIDVQSNMKIEIKL